MNIMFQHRFAEKVASGQKRQTIRPPRKDGKPVCRVGQMLSLRQWEGVAYRSKQVKLIEDTPCVATGKVYLSTIGCVIIGDGMSLMGDELEQFARADGFESHAEMFKYFEESHGLPFEGVLIQW